MIIAFRRNGSVSVRGLVFCYFGNLVCLVEGVVGDLMLLEVLENLR